MYGTFIVIYDVMFKYVSCIVMYSIYILYIKLNYPLALGYCSCIPQRMAHVISAPATKLKPRVAVAMAKMASLGNYRWDGTRLETKWGRIAPTFPIREL